MLVLLYLVDQKDFISIMPGNTNSQGIEIDSIYDSYINGDKQKWTLY